MDDYDAVTTKLVEIYTSAEVLKAFQVIDSVVQTFQFQDSVSEQNRK